MHQLRVASHRRRAAAALTALMLVSGAGVQSSADAASGAAKRAGVVDVVAFGNAKDFGSTDASSFNAPIVGMARTASSRGYWEAASDGGVYSFGDARFYGSMGGKHLNQPIVAIASTPTGKGYWLAASDGGIFTFGDAHFYGSTGGTHLNAPVVAFAPTPSGKGYRLAARDGGIFSFGYTRPHGQVFHGRYPIVGMSAALPKDVGFWLVDSMGHTFAFGIPHYFANDTAGISKPVVGIVTTGNGLGYWIVGRGTPRGRPGPVTVRKAGHSGGSGEIEVRWDEVPGADGYRVTRALSASGPFVLAADANLTTGAIFKASGVTNLFIYTQTRTTTAKRFQYVELIAFTNNVRRYYQVFAYNAAGESVPSATVCGTPLGYPTC